MSALPIPPLGKGPRIQPITKPEWNDKVREYFGLAEGVGTEGGEPKINVVKTLARHPDLALAYRAFGKHIRLENTLPRREQELITLRTALLSNSHYEWVKHVALAKTEGFSDGDIEAIRVGPDAPGWSDVDRALLRAVDQLMDKTDIDDATWKALTDNFSEHQVIDIVFTIGSYVMLAMVLNAARVQLED